MVAYQRPRAQSNEERATAVTTSVTASTGGNGREKGQHMSTRTWGTVAALVATLGAGAASPGLAQRPLQAGHIPASSTRGTQGYLGVNFREVSEELLTTLPAKETRGVEITQVDHDGPAGKAGIREHDVLLQMNNQPIEGVEPLRRMLHDIAPGRAITLLLSRDGQTQILNVLLVNREALERQAWDQHIPVPDPSVGSGSATVATSGARPERSADARGGSMGFFSSGGPTNGGSTGSRFGDHGLGGSASLTTSYTGAALESLGPQLAQFFGVPDGNGLLVRSIENNSPAATAGLKAGDVVVRVNQVAILSGGDWLRLMHENKGRAVPVTILRDKKELTLTLTPDAKRRSRLALPPLPSDPAVLAARATVDGVRGDPRL